MHSGVMRQSLIDVTPSAVAWTKFPLTSLIDMLLSTGLMALGTVIMAAASVALTFKRVLADQEALA